MKSKTKFELFSGFLAIVFVILSAGCPISAQEKPDTKPPEPVCPEGSRLIANLTNPYKIKLAQSVSSSTARVEDYVEFTLMEDIYSVPAGACKAQVLIASGTPIFGVVIRRKHRHFPFVGGNLEVSLDMIKHWDGTLIPVYVDRHKIPGERNRLPCTDPRFPCIAGRRNAAVSPVVPAIAATGSTVVAARAQSTATRIIAGTALFGLVTQSGIGDLLNGTDAQISSGEVFDLYIMKPVRLTARPK